MVVGTTALVEQISVAACALAGAHNAKATKHIARKLPVKNRFMKWINTIALYTLNCAAEEIYCVEENILNAMRSAIKH